ncbi:sugar kinase [Bradyrhizobium sp. LHD-71]|uniref:sugar kinase n=1 Tax=Bradyrhizobium sp. LHD-71 TaxID=3072141 RepID=UPI00280DB9A6|nr:sugar kinase [Bradyrhizobium sp. LHD-71]MDQ8729322.1 sugar kinase [Bradyrhizobium sp. LHD-71]
MSFDIVAIGEPMIEFNQTGQDDGLHYLQGFGGDSSNFIIAAARQGARTGYLTALGDDAYGRMFLDLWRAEGVDSAAVKIDPTAPTAVYFVTHDAGGHAFHFYRTGSAASRLAPSDIDRNYVSSARVVHCSGISLAISASACDACYTAVEAAKAAGRMVSFDTNLRLKLWPKDRARAVTTDMMSLCDICLPSYDDMLALTGIDDAEALVDFALARGARIVALKLGDRGAIVASATERHHIAPFPVRAQDATGAGDTFGGAFVARLLLGDDLATAGRYAAVAAAISTTGFGAVAPIPRADQVKKALESGA